MFPGKGKQAVLSIAIERKEMFIMNIKIIIILTVLVIITSALCFFFYSTTGNKGDTDEKNSIKNTIEKVLRIKYGWANKEGLKDISTKEFQENLDEESFYKGLDFYQINRDFMKSYEEIDPNTVIVDCRIDFFFKEGYIPIITLTKTLDGVYLISDIQYDK